MAKRYLHAIFAQIKRATPDHVLNVLMHPPGDGGSLGLEAVLLSLLSGERSLLFTPYGLRSLVDIWSHNLPCAARTTNL